MSLLIKGLHKPINCRECRAIGYDKLAHCSKWWELHFEESDCPLVEVPTPHGDLIDRNKIDYCDYDIENSRTFVSMTAAEKEWIDEMPAIIKAED